MDFSLARYDNGPCPYLPGRSWRVEGFHARSLAPAAYESLLAAGFRRSAFLFYRNACPGCSLCIPLRLVEGQPKLGRNARRLERRNADLSLSLLPGDFSEERYELYARYVAARHREEDEAPPPTRESYAAFLLGGPLGGGLVSEYRDGSGKLVATGYLDELPGGLSSVYFAFDPEESERSVGTWSMLAELELAASLGMSYYYLGFWVPGSPKMGYKARFAPFEYAREGSWRPAESAAAVPLGELVA